MKGNKYKYIKFTQMTIQQTYSCWRSQHSFGGSEKVMVQGNAEKENEER